MRRLFLIALLSSALLPVAAVGENIAFGPNDTFGYSSEDWGGGSYLGVDTRDITPDRLAPLHLKEERGVEVTMVDQDAPAGKAGVKEQDVIMTLNGEKVESVEQLRRMIRETPPGRIVTLGILRNGQQISLKVPLGDRKQSYAYSYGPNMKDFHFEMPKLPAIPDIDVPVSIVVVHSSVRSGLMVENLTSQLGDFFGTKNGQGVLVRSVEKGSRADKAGFHAGDVIVKINGESIHDSSDFSHALRGRKDNTASVSILRDKKEQTITLTLPDRNQSDMYRESFDMENLDAETREELGRLKSDLARMKPDMEEAVSRQLQLAKPEIERQASELAKQREQLQKQMREVQRQFREHQHEIEQELRETLREHESEF